MASKKTNAIAILLSDRRILRYAGQPSYARGEEYFEERRVKNLVIEDDHIRARVHGSHIYRVELWDDGGDLACSCTCPFFEQEEAFCKHCVAVSFAARKELEESSRPAKKGRLKQRVLSSSDIKKFLSTQDKDTLVSLLMDHTQSDDRLLEKLRMKTAGADTKRGITSFRHSIDEAVSWGEYIDYKSMHEYTSGIDDVIASLDDLLKAGEAEAVIELTEYSLRRLEEQMDMVDDSDGLMSGILEEVQELHYQACTKAQPDPETLAEKLFQWELNSDWEVFAGAAQRYARILGKKGMEHYRSRAEKEWARVPVIGPGKEMEEYRGTRYRITQIMETLATHDGSIEQLVAIKSKNLSLPYDYLEIAQIYKKAGKEDKTLEWALKGVKSFPNHSDTRLHEFLAEEYQQRKRFGDAMELIWKIFVENPGLESCKLLKRHATRTGGAGAWREWREKALACIRTKLAKRKSGAQSKWYENTIDHSDLVRIFLWEKETAQAWQEAQQGGCTKDLWLKLARLREQGSPEDALSVYQTFVEPTIRQANNEAYREAVSLIKKVRLLMKRLERMEEWDRFLEPLKTTYKRKRNFMKLLEESVG